MDVWPPTSYKLIDIWPKDSGELNYMGSNDKIQLEFKTVDTTFMNKNKDTFVCYSCAEGLNFDKKYVFIHIINLYIISYFRRKNLYRS
jgi:hypothetical protein